MLKASERLRKVFDITFGGIHNTPKIYKFQEGEGMCEYWETSYPGDVSTFDWDKLTRFVFACHAYCVRGSICPSGPMLVKFRIYPRFTRVGRLTEKHPSLEEAVANFRRDFKC